MDIQRIQPEHLRTKVRTSAQAADCIKDKMVVASSGFTKSGDSKAVLAELATKALNNPFQITLITGASLGYETDGVLVNANVLAKRMPFQSDPVLRKAINEGKVLFVDQHLSETVEQLHNGHLPNIDVAIIEATSILADGSLVPTTSVGNSVSFAALADKLIIEINMAMREDLIGIHDIYLPHAYPNREGIPIIDAQHRFGAQTIQIDVNKIEAIVFTNIPDCPAVISEPDAKTSAIADRLLNFFNKEIEAGRLTHSLLPLQVGIGKVANAVLTGFTKGNFKNLTMYSEVIQDSTFELMDAGIMDFASASSITLSEGGHQKLMANFEQYKGKLLLRPQNISNLPEVIRRLGVIAINTAIEFDIYGNVNSTHISGVNMMNGIGGSGDFARNAYLSIFVTQSASKENKISHVVPMVSHTDHTEHDVDILVTDQGLADLRGLSPRERARVIIDKCVHPDYKDQLESYFQEALQSRGGQTPHVLEKCFSWHTNLREKGTMKF